MTESTLPGSLSAGTKVSVDYDQENAVAETIKANAFDYGYLSFGTDDIPAEGKGQVEQEVFELHLNRTIYSRDLPQELDSRGLQFADPLTAFDDRFAEAPGGTAKRCSKA